MFPDDCLYPMIPLEPIGVIKTLINVDVMHSIQSKSDISHNFRTPILQMVISCDKIFLLVLKYLFLWSWPYLVYIKINVDVPS